MMTMESWPKNVGILAIELIFPSAYVDQSELEEYDGVSSGKYTVGLGQSKMGFCTDREDVNSLCLTVVQKLLDRHQLKPTQIGRLEVGTETIIDKSKSVKSVLMQLFEPFGATDIEGVDTTNACYGGTAALFNCISWVESSAWDGRLALAVAADIAVYAKGSARPTGGVGAVAMLIGADAPLVLERGLRASYMRHAYDFYKPDLTSEYPTVDGKLSIQCYLQALDNCYQLYCNKVAKLRNEDITLQSFNAVLFHSPYCKLVQKSLARLMLNDLVRKPNAYPNLSEFKNVKLEDTYFDRNVEKAFVTASTDLFKQKTKPSLLLANQVGNMYTPSVYGGLVSLLINSEPDTLAGQRIGLFSYGSGLAATFYSLRVSHDVSDSSTLRQLINGLSHIKTLLDQRRQVAPQDFEQALLMRERSLHTAPYTPQGPVDHFFPGTFYLSAVDELHRRSYKRVPESANGTL